MKDLLSKERVEQYLADLRKAALFERCWTCFLLQRFLSQLEIDAHPDATPLIGPLVAPRNRWRGHCGCKPCLTDEAFTSYLQETRPRLKDGASS